MKMPLQTTFQECLQKSCTEREERSAVSVISRRLHDAMSRLMLSGDSRSLSYPIRQHSIRDAANDVSPGAATPQMPSSPLVNASRKSKTTPKCANLQPQQEPTDNGGLGAPAEQGGFPSRRGSFRRQVSSMPQRTESLLYTERPTLRRRLRRNFSQRRPQNEFFLEERPNEASTAIPQYGFTFALS